MVVVITGATLAVTRPWAAASPRPDLHGFVHFANAVTFPPLVPSTRTDSGAMMALVPDGACPLGLGEIETDRILPAYWPSGGHCEHFGMTTPNSGEGEPGSGPASSNFAGSMLTGAVTAPDGSLIMIGDYQQRNDYLAASGQVYSLTSAGLQLVTQLDPPENADKSWQDASGQVMFNAVVQAGGTLLIGGKQSTPTSEGRPKIWTSTDGGKSLDAIDLPVAPNLVAQVQAMAVHGNTVLALGTATADERHDTLVGWVSTDQGRTWAAIATQNFATSLVSGIVFANGQWFAAGDTQGARMPEPVVLSSADAQHWQVTSLPAPDGGGNVTGIAVNREDTPIVVGWTGTPPSGPHYTTTECGAIWLVSPPATWTDVNTGCGGAIPAGVVTLPDGRVLVASNHDLWIHP